MNIRRRVTAIAAAMFALILGAMPADSQDLTPQQILDRAITGYENVESHSYTWYAEGMDTFSKDRQKEIQSSNQKYAKKAGAEEVEEEAKLVRGKYEMKFMKPYLAQMRLVKSDFVPKIGWGMLLTYRSDTNPDVWWAKPKISPMAVKRSVADDDAAGSITSNWTVVFLYMLYYSQNAEMTLQPDAEADGHDCYVIRYNFDWEKRPEWDHKKPDFGKFGVPEQIETLIWKDMLNIEEQKFSYIDYYIDKEKFWPRKTEEYINGKFHWRNTLADAKVNDLTVKDF